MIVNKNIDPAANVAVSKLALADAKIIIGNASGVGAAQTPSGDVTITNAGVTAIGGTKVTNAMLAGSIAPGKITVANTQIVVGNGSGVGAAVAMSGDTTIANTGAVTIGALKVTDGMLAGSITQAKLTAASLDGTVAKVVADVNVIGGIPVVHRIAVADATGNTDVTLTHKTLVIEVVVVKTAANGGAGDQVIVQNGATAITNAISTNIVDTTVARAGTIDDAQHEIAAAGTLRVAATKATNTACIVYVFGLRVA